MQCSAAMMRMLHSMQLLRAVRHSQRNGDMPISWLQWLLPCCYCATDGTLQLPASWRMLSWHAGGQLFIAQPHGPAGVASCMGTALQAAGEHVPSAGYTPVVATGAMPYRGSRHSFMCCPCSLPHVATAVPQVHMHMPCMLLEQTHLQELLLEFVLVLQLQVCKFAGAVGAELERYEFIFCDALLQAWSSARPALQHM